MWNIIMSVYVALIELAIELFYVYFIVRSPQYEGLAKCMIKTLLILWSGLNILEASHHPQTLVGVGVLKCATKHHYSS